jgi:hypothetical protein
MILSRKFPMLLCGIAVLVAMPAAAQNGASWVDDRGRLMTFQFAGGSGAAPIPKDQSAEAMASLFKDICLLPSHGTDSMKTAGDALGLTYNEVVVPAGKNPPVSLNIWRRDGVVVSETSGFASARNPQCNAAFHVNTLPERQDVLDAFEKVIGYGPTNSADAFKKNGKPNKRYSPEWAITNDAGQTGTVMVFVIKYTPGNRVQLSISYPLEKKKI